MKTSYFALLLATMLIGANVCAQSSNLIENTSTVFSSGGGTSIGGSYTFTHTLGQAIAGDSSGGNYTLAAGFWAPDAADQDQGIDLELIASLSPIVLTENFTAPLALSVSNRGPDTATGVQLSVTLPAGLFVQAATNSAGTCQVTSSNVTCSVASLSSHGAFMVELTLRAKFLPEQADEFARLSNLSSIVSSTEPDLNPADNPLALAVTVWQQLDWGDARGGFPVSLAENGARHRYWPGYLLGALWDRQTDGIHSALADWDDTHTLDDEDGIVFLTPLVPGESASVMVSSSFAGFLDAWADFNDDSDWTDPGERLFTTIQPLVAGANVLTFSVPATAVPGLVTTRWRASTTGGQSFTGYGGKGEVEDHLILVRAVPRPGLKHSAGVSRLTFQTETQANYVVEYTDSLTPPNWTPLIRVAGTGDSVVVTDDMTGSTRFYRVLIE